MGEIEETGKHWGATTNIGIKLGQDISYHIIDASIYIYTSIDVSYDVYIYTSIDVSYDVGLN